MSIIAQIKKEIPLAPWLAPYTNGLKSSGRNFMIGDCPVCHKSKTFWVHTLSQSCGCFSSKCRAYCNVSKDPSTKPLDIINVYAIIHGVSLKQAVLELSEKAGLR